MIDHADRTWWRHAVIYQVDIRSSADGNGNGIGDIEGLRSRLPYLRDLRADAIWITPLDDGLLPPDAAIWLGR